MTQAILTLNAGSSSLKLALYPLTGDRPMATGLVDAIGPAAAFHLKGPFGQDMPTVAGDLSTHEAALQTVVASLRGTHPDLTLLCIGHRVLHGGDHFSAPVTVTEEILALLDPLAAFAPLHQPHNLAGIRAAMAAFPGVPQVACFDTAFHRHHPWVNDAFALPRAFHDQGVRRYGFHGLSYDHVATALRQIAPQLTEGRVVVAHLGNGASMCALQDGRSIASTMGFTALDGLPMGTRCGQIDPGVLLYLMQHRGMSADEISDMLYRRSGLLGLSGLSSDMRTLEAAGTPEARQAIDYFVSCAQREVGAMAAALGGIDALVFCGGIGENSRLIRERICERLGWMGIEIDHARNGENATVISSDFARTMVMIIPTNEELVIARAARAALGLGERSVA
ncbi:acetate/propionate family kinase [Rhodobacter capsulatus]|uniref:Acetate kinase n=1 Tax=Rhodobacter capsulatus TaxID=1061 RepID=A0A1G7SW21_RHOCA|nr:acetate/propionate family kinase [Rhodobacter capsulatus]WER08602.1 acetate/propionate family kinase [Rhodobacter capsulatus]SDG27286.1 acetate kinase [Rhodobacter capsulatus]